MGPPGKLERDACRMAADLPWQISRDLVLKWAEGMVAARRSGRRIETADAWIAATALLYDATFLTHNRTDYLGVPNLRFSDD